jgi:hypothetical protein
MSAELTITVLNILISLGFFIGVYKNKIDTANKMMENFRDIEIRIARLEEKLNFVIDKMKTV